MSQVQLIVKSFPQVVGGKFVDQYVVIEATSGELVGKKAHKTEAEANAELGTLKYFAEGLSFARATAPEGATDKGLVGKANTIAAYLLWKDGGVAEAATAEAEVATEEAPASEEENFDA